MRQLGFRTFLDGLVHDNGFKVIPMSDLGYDESTNYMNIE
jgi:hypothetical protein